MFKSVSIQNFRGIRRLDIKDLNTINVFVGDNATGKTAVLDAIYILINPNNPELPLKTNDWRNIMPFTSSFWRSLFYDFDFNNEIQLIAETTKDKREVSIKAKRSISDVVVSNQSSNGEPKASSSLEKAVVGLDIVFQIDKSKYKSAIEQKSLNEAKLDPDKSYEEQLQGNYQNSKTYANEIDLSAKFDAVNQEIGKEVMIDFLRKFKPEIEDIELDRFMKLLIKDKSFGNKRVYLNSYGDGMVRGLHMLLDILSKKSGITLIDEVENGLHWSKQEIVWQFVHALISERGQQLFITTHSREMVEHLYQVAKKENFLKLIQLYRLQMVDGIIKFVQYGAKELEFALTHEEEFR